MQSYVPTETPLKRLPEPRGQQCASTTRLCESKLRAA